jgi:hypothetical protein
MLMSAQLTNKTTEGVAAGSRQGRKFVPVYIGADVPGNRPSAVTLEFGGN